MNTETPRAMAPLTSAALNATFQPYGFLLKGGRRPYASNAMRRANKAAIDVNTSGSRSAPRTSGSTATPGSIATSMLANADAESVAAALPTVIADSEHGRLLGDTLDFIAPPAMKETDAVVPPGSSRCLFMGHLRFETTSQDMRWLIKKLTGVNPLKCEIRGNGCCVVYLATDRDVAAVRALNRRVLFDRHGFWFARTPEATEVLTEYVEHTIPSLNQLPTGKRRALRLPRDALVVEESRSFKFQRRAKGTAAATPSCSSSSAVGGLGVSSSKQQQQQQRPQYLTMSHLTVPHHGGSGFQSHVTSTTATPLSAQHGGFRRLSQAQHAPVSPYVAHGGAEECTSGMSSAAPSFNFHDCLPDYVLPVPPVSSGAAVKAARAPVDGSSDDDMPQPQQPIHWSGNPTAGVSASAMALHGHSKKGAADSVSLQQQVHYRREARMVQLGGSSSSHHRNGGLAY